MTQFPQVKMLHIGWFETYLIKNEVFKKILGQKFSKKCYFFGREFGTNQQSSIYWWKSERVNMGGPEKGRLVECVGVGWSVQAFVCQCRRWYFVQVRISFPLWRSHRMILHLHRKCLRILKQWSCLHLKLWIAWRLLNLQKLHDRPNRQWEPIGQRFESHVMSWLSQVFKIALANQISAPILKTHLIFCWILPILKLRLQFSQMHERWASSSLSLLLQKWLHRDEDATKPCKYTLWNFFGLAIFLHWVWLGVQLARKFPAGRPYFGFK